MRDSTPIMAGHPPTQQQKEEEEEGFVTTPLHMAVLQGDHVLLENLLRHGGFVDAPDDDLQTPLLLASQCTSAIQPQ